MNIEKMIFTVSANNKLTYEQHIVISEFTKEVITETESKVSAYYYGVLVKLADSINNAGYEKRRSNDIQFINDELDKIADISEKYLP